MRLHIGEGITEIMFCYQTDGLISGGILLGAIF